MTSSAHIHWRAWSSKACAAAIRACSAGSPHTSPAMPATTILHTRPDRRAEATMNHAFRMKLKPGQAAEYRRRHDAIWPELAALLREVGIHDYSIFLDEETLHLFAVLKLREPNERAALPEHPLMRRWWDYMRDLMETQPDGRPVEWPLLPVFHL